MTYFNGNPGNMWLGEWHPGTPVTRIYCDECAETEIPLPPREEKPIGRHYDTGFKWAPYYGGSTVCLKCGRPA
jgi:hypothetical protein